MNFVFFPALSRVCKYYFQLHAAPTTSSNNAVQRVCSLRGKKNSLKKHSPHHLLLPIKHTVTIEGHR